MRGGDALTLALNAVAVLFLLELDNIFYAIALGERVRARVETVGRVNLAPREAQSLVVSKVAHCTIVAGSFLVSLTQIHRLTGEITDAKYCSEEYFLPSNPPICPCTWAQL